LKIGDTVWYFDENHREYAPRIEGRCSFGGPVWRKHWVPMTITGETSRSWTTSKRDRKVSKNGADRRVWALSEEQIEEMELVEYRYHISEAVSNCYAPATLRAVADLVGWKPKP
jgi:hypothetical protein